MGIGGRSGGCEAGIGWMLGGVGTWSGWSQMGRRLGGAGGTSPGNVLEQSFRQARVSSLQVKDKSRLR